MEATQQHLVANHLRETIASTLPLLQALSDGEVSKRPAPGKWSPKEILGHLIDSACNNHQKFIRTMAEPSVEFVGYKQDFWVEQQHYNERPWHEILALWSAYNLHLAHIIEHTSASVLGNTIRIEGSAPFALGFIMPDYVEHLKHHILQILPNSPITSQFANVYNA